MERMKSKAGYGAVGVLTLIIALTQEGEFPRFLLGFEVVLAAALFFSLKVLAGKIEVHFRLPVLADSRSKEIVVEAEIVNHSILPVPALTAGFIWEDVISGERGTVQMPAMADSRGRSAARFRLRTGHCGVIRVLPGEVWVKDYLALFRRKTAPAPGNPDGTLVNAILYHAGKRLSSINGTIRPGIVHRIDKDTSGLLMIAKNDLAHESLAAQLKEHSVTREYQALVFDNIKEEELTVDRPIGRDRNNRLRRAVGGDAPREAVTHVKVLERFGKYTLISAVLETGRTHQIRVHLASIHHPLVGDTMYGPKKQPWGLEGQLLHAKVLGFDHPRTGERLLFDSELPPYFEKVLTKLRKERGDE